MLQTVVCRYFRGLTDSGNFRKCNVLERGRELSCFVGELLFAELLNLFYVTG